MNGGPNAFDATSRQWTELNAELAREKLQNKHESLRVEELQKKLAEVERERDAVEPTTLRLRAFLAQAESERDALKAELSRYSMGAGEADQFRCEAKSVRVALGFAADSGDVCPNDLTEAIASLRSERDALSKALEKYGRHTDRLWGDDVCDLISEGIGACCSCGLNAALSTTEAK